METGEQVIVGCPGKVLICGGYLVLEPQYEGTVISTEAQFYTILKMRKQKEGPSIKVSSLQFENKSWFYNFENGKLIERLEDESNSKNKFVYSALLAVYQFISYAFNQDLEIYNKLNTFIDIELKADNDFYSQREQLKQRNLPTNFKSLEQLPTCNYLGGRLEEAHKTGLGSSACLVSSLVGAALTFFIGNQAPNFTTICHNLAQFAHCRAQGKIGSGFDVAAAIFGSHVYKRFDPKVIQFFLTWDDIVEKQNFVECIYGKGWDQVIKPFKLPPRIKMSLGEVDTGSNTPSMVSKVLKWKSANPESADKIWNDLNQRNSSVLKLLINLQKQYDINPEAYNTTMSQLQNKNLYEESIINGLASSPDETENIISKLSTTFKELRNNLRLLTEQAQVPIEPKEQSELLDHLLQFSGSILAGVPGAGGYDAVFILYIDDDSNSNRNHIQSRMDSFNLLEGAKVAPLLSMDQDKKGMSITFN